ncbi:MAG: hypothetical protein WAX89_04430 [Alphaproteobacteria bacterium]
MSDAYTDVERAYYEAVLERQTLAGFMADMYQALPQLVEAAHIADAPEIIANGERRMAELDKLIAALKPAAEAAERARQQPQP